MNEADTDAAGLLPEDPNEWTLRLRSAERIREASRERLNQRLGRSQALIVVTEGRVRLALERRQTELNQGSVYWCAPETTFGFEACDSAFELYLFHFDVYRLRQAEDGVDASAERVRSVPPGRRLFAAASDRLPALCADIWRHWEGNERMGIFRSQLDFQELMYDLLSGLLPNPDNSSEGLEVALQYMEEHYAEPWTIERLARVAGVSPKYFVDLFKKRYGVSAMERLTAIRLSRAKQLMEQPALKLRDIAHRVGYADEFYFSRKFKKEIGVSPTDYRKRRRLRLAAYSQELLGMLLPLNVLPFAAPLHPKWTAYYYRVLRDDIPVHLNANRYRRSWRTDAELLREASVDLILAPDNLDGEERRALDALDLLQLDEVSVRGLGVRADRERRIQLLCCVGLVSACVSVSGSIGFVGLIAPHIARRLTGVHYPYIVPVSGAVGMTLVVVCDLIGKTVFAPAELPVGIVVSIVGVPYFISLLYRSRKK